MSELKSIIEEIEELTQSMPEQTLIDQFDGAEVEAAPEVEATTTEKLDARTKISRAYDVFKAAAVDFDAAVLENGDLLGDAEIINLKDEILNKLDELAYAIDPNAKKEEAPAAEEAPIVDAEVETSEEDEEENAPEQDFDSQAALDFGI